MATKKTKAEYKAQAAQVKRILAGYRAPKAAKPVIITARAFMANFSGGSQ